MKIARAAAVLASLLALAGCSDGTPPGNGCAASQIMCAGRCVDPQTDRAFCGASGNCAGADAGVACAAGRACVAGACAVCAPVAAISATSPAIVGVEQTLSASIAGGCTAAPVWSYAWALSSKPAGSLASLDVPSAASPRFTPDLLGAYEVSLTVTDDLGNASVPVSRTVLAAPCSSTAPAVAFSAVRIDPSPGGQALVDALPSGAGSTTAMAGTLVEVTAAAVPLAACSPLGYVLSYRWTLLSRPPGSTAALAGAQDRTAAIVPDVPGGTWQLSAVVTDGLGNQSAPQLFTVTTTSCGASVPAVSIAPASATVDAFELLALAAAGLSNADYDPTACPSRFALGGSYAYAWRVAASPPGATARLGATTGSATTFLGQTPSGGMPYLVELVATAPSGVASAPAQASITVNPCGAYAPAALRRTAPLPAVPALQATQTRVSGAAAAADETTLASTLFDANRPVQLTANVVDLDEALTSQTFSLGGALVNGCLAAARPTTGFTTSWSLVSAPSGSRATLTRQSDSTVILTPDLAAPPGAGYVVRLVATDATGLSSAQQWEVTVGSCGTAPPVVAALAVSPANPGVGVPVSVTATVSDADASPSCSQPLQFAYAWTLTGLPAGSLAALSGAGTATASFTPDRAGLYSLQVQVADPLGLSSLGGPATVSVTCGGAPPRLVDNDPLNPPGTPAMKARQVVPSLTLTGGPATNYVISRDTIGNAVPNLAVGFQQGVPVQLVAAPADPDNDPAGCNLGQVLTYRWALAAAPAGSAAALNGVGLASPSFVPDAPGTYAFDLAVTDPTGLSASRAFSVDVGACGGQAPAAAIGLLAPLTWPVAAPPRAPVPALSTVQLEARVTDPDAVPLDPATGAGCGRNETFGYTWTLVSRPALSSAALSGAATETPGLAPAGFAGDYAVRLVASDGLHASAPVDVTLHAELPAPVTTAAASYFTATAVDQTTGDAYVALLDNTNGRVQVAHCTQNCDGAGPPAFTMLPDVDSGLGVLTVGAADARPVDVKARGGRIAVAYVRRASCRVQVAVWDGVGWNLSAPMGNGGGCAGAQLPGVGAGEAGRWLSLDLDSNGVPSLAWNETAQSAGAVSGSTWYARCVANCSAGGAIAFSAPAQLAQVVPTTSVPSLTSVSLAHDASGRPRFAQRVDNGDGTGGLLYLECSTVDCLGAAPAAGWAEQVSTGAANFGHQASIALPASGAPAVAIAHTVGTSRAPRLATCAAQPCAAGPGAWVSRTLTPDPASVSLVGRCNSIRYDVAGRFKLAYVDVGAGTMALADGNDLGTVLGVVDNTSSPRYCSMALTSGGAVRLAWVRSSTAQVEYAAFGP